MKEIRINNFEEKLFYEKLDNGLEIYLLPLMHKKNYIASFGVKYGSRNTKFKVNNKEYVTPGGIAHFLEHKMFERENDPFSYFEKSGTDVNAATSYDFTHYYIFGSKNFEENLKYMTNWPKNIDITEEGVEKEKGIIIEEANMYKDNPARVLNEKIKEKIFLKDPYKNKVIGTTEDIKNITKEDIELCFNSFYTPNNMFYIIVGNFDKEKALKIIKDNTKDLKPNYIIEKIYDKEPDEIDNKEETIKFNIDMPRISVAYKFNKDIFKSLNITSFQLDLYIHFLISIGLGPMSETREKWVKENLFLSSMYRITESKTHYTVEFSALSNYPDKLKEKLIEYLKDIKIDKDSFEREKKLWIANEIESISNISTMKYNIMDDILDYKEFIPNKIEIIKKLDYKTLEKLKNIIKFNEIATVKLMPKSEK